MGGQPNASNKRANFRIVKIKQQKAEKHLYARRWRKCHRKSKCRKVR